MIAQSLLSILMTVAALNPTASPVDVEHRESRLFRAMGWVSYGLHATDLLTTEYAIGQGHRELNPLGQHWAARATIKPAVAVGTNKLTAELYQDRPRWALWTRIAVNVAMGYLVVHNINAIR